MSNLTPDDVDLRLTATKAELTEEDQRLWLGLEDEKISRIAGDEANKQFNELVQQQNSGTESRLSTEVIHRSEGDVSNLNSLNAVAQALSDYRIKTDLEINNEVIARKALGVDLNSRIDSFMASWDHDKFLIYRTIQEVQDDVDGKYVSMDTRITKYEQMLSDITADSIQITMDNGEINMGAWTILSQAREWDLQIIGRMKDFQIKTEEDLNQALEDIQNSLPVEQDIIDKAIEALSNAPIIKELDTKIANNIADIDTVHRDLLTEVTTRQNEMVAQAQNTADELKKQSDALNATITAEANARIDAIEREATIRASQLEQEALDRAAEIDEKLQDLNVVIDGDLAAVNGRIDATNDTIAELNQNLDRDVAAINDRVDAVNAKADAIKVESDQKILDLNTKADGIHDDVSAETAARIAAVTALNDGLTSEIQHRKDGDQVITTALENYKSSNDTALANVRTELTANVTATTANATKIDALDVRLTTNETETDEAKALAATATQKADTALTETSALASQMTTVNASIDGIKDDLVNKADAAAFNQLKAEVVEIDGKVLTNTQDLTALKTTVTGLDGKVTGNTSAISELTTQQVVQGDQITQLTSDTTALKNSLEAVEDDLATKVDSTAFNELSTKVNKNASDITVQAGSITKLQSDLVLANQAINTKANATALNALDTKVTQQGNTITSQGGAITQLQNDVSSIDTELDSKASSAALSALDTKVTQQGGVLTSQGTAITKLENDLSTVNTELDTKADSAALNALDSKVTTIDGKVTSQGTSLTSLTNRVTKNEGDISKKAEATALTALTTRVTNAEGVNTSQGTAITKLTNDLATTNGKVDTKADATALTALDSKVTSVDGKVTTNSSAITTLSGRVTTTEQRLATKLDASVISGYYTKGQTDAKAAEIAAGKVEEFNANLVIGGTNLVTKSYKNFRVGTAASPALVREILADGSLKLTSSNMVSSTYLAYWVGSSSSMQAMFDELVVDNPFTVTLWFKAVDLQNLPTTTPTLYFGGGLNYLSLNADLTQLASGKEVAYTHTRNWTGLASSIPHLSFSAAALGGGLILTKWKVEKGSKSTDWTESPQDTRNLIDANSTAIQNTNAEVSRVDGIVQSQSTKITELTASVDKNTTDIATKANAQAVADLSTRVTTTENAITVQSQDLVRLQNTLDVTNAAVSQKADSSALTALTTEVTNINNKVTVNSNAITSLSGRVTTVEQGLTTKLNASVINAYSTTVDMNNAIANSITTYNAGLVIGGENLYLGANPITLSGRAGELTVVTTDTAVSQLFKYLTATELDITQLSVGDKTVASMEFFIPSSTSNDFEFRFATYRFNPSSIGGGYNQTEVLKASQFPRDKWFQLSLPTGVLPTATVAASNINISLYVYRRYTGDVIRWRNLMMEKGTKASSYSEPTSALKSSINANATAIQSTNASVTTLDGRVTSNSSAITSLNNRMTVAEGNISQKADASALSTLATRVTNNENTLVTQGDSITQIRNNITTLEGKVELKADTAALNTLSNTVTQQGTKIDANSAALTKVQASLSLSSPEVKITGNADGLLNDAVYPTINLDPPVLVAEPSAYSGSVIRYGNNNGNDYHVVINPTFVVIDPNKLYRFRYRFRRVEGTSSSIYLGLQPASADKKFNVSNSNSLVALTGISSALYAVVTGSSSLGAWVEGEYFFKGKSAGATTGTGTLADPRTFPALSAYFRVMGLYNYINSTGIQDVDYIIVEDYTAMQASNANATATQALTARVTTAEGTLTNQSNAVTKLQNDLVQTNTTATNADLLAKFQGQGKLLSIDPTFKRNPSVGQVITYGSNTTVASNLTRVARSADNPTDSPYEMNRVFIGDPNTGTYGFNPANPVLAARANAVFLQKLVIKLPVGFYLGYGSNSIGSAASGGYQQFIGSVEGTGRFEVYYRLIVCGAEGPFSTTGHVRLIRDTGTTIPSSGAPVTMTIAQHALFDVTEAPDAVPKALWDQVTANASAIQTLDNKVTQQGTDITSLSTAQTSLSNRVSTVEGALTNKADSSAVQQLDSRVTTAEGKITTNATAITNLSNSFNILDGKVNTKADSSALNAYYTKAETDSKATTIAAGEVSKYDASLVIGGANIVRESNKFLVGSGGTGITKEVLANGSLKLTGAGNTYHSFTTNTTVTSDTSSLSVGDKFTVTFWVKAVDVTNLPTVMPHLYLAGPNPAYLNNFRVIGDLSKGGAVRYVQTRTCSQASSFLGITHMHWVAGALGGGLIIEKWQIESGTQSTDWSPNNTEVQSSINANASAIQSTNSEVARVDGRVTSNSTNLTALTGRVSTVEGTLATKADVSAVNTLSTRVGNVEGGLATQASDITTLSSKIDSRAGGASLIPDYLMANANEWRSHYGYNLASYFVKVSDGKITDTVFRKPANVASCWNYSRTAVPNDRAYKVSMWVRRAEGSAGAVYFTCNLIGPDGVHDTTNTYVAKGVPATNVWTYVEQVWNQTGTKEANPQLAFGFALNHAVSGAIAEMQGFKVEAVISTADTDTTLATANALTTTNTEVSRINGVVTSQGTSITTLQSGLTTTNNNIATKADSSALTALDTKVTQIDGRVTTQSSSITQLQADVSGNSAKLIVQGEVVDGLKASYVVKTDVNGLVAGYGLYNTGSSSAFGVNADFFYVGKGTTAENGKKPFMVLTAPTTIGGVTYPAGTWIDVALIANATIGTAHIADASITNAKISSLDAAKITTGTLDAARIKVGAATQYEIGYDPITKARTFVAQPVTPYRIGDIWKNGSTTSICTVTRLTGAYVAADWGKTGDVTSLNTAADTSKVGGVAAATVNQNITNADTKAGNAVTAAATADAKAVAADNKATTAQSAADSANNQVNAWKFTGTTEIDGGKIRADTVTAVQISVAELSAITGNFGEFTTYVDPAQPLKGRHHDNGLTDTWYDDNNVKRIVIGKIS